MKDIMPFRNANFPSRDHPHTDTYHLYRTNESCLRDHGRFLPDVVDSNFEEQLRRDRSIQQGVSA